MKPIPTLKDLFTGIKSSFRSVLGATVSDTGKSFLRDLGGVWAGKLKVAYAYLANNQKNAWYDTADGGGPTSMLWRQGFSILGEYPKPGTQGQYVCNVTGSAGATIDANTTFRSDADSQSPNLLFILDAAYTLTGSGDTITLRATVAGTAAALAIGNTLTCTKPLIDVNQQVAVASIAVSPIDAETDEEYRSRIDTHWKLAPQGGAVADYILWATNVAGVRKVYPYTAGGAVWEVDVYIEAFLTDSGGSAPDYNYGIPTSTILTNSTNAILTDPSTGLARKPMGVILGPADVGAIAVTVYQVVITFTGTGGMSSDDKNAIVAALQAAVANIRPYIGAAYPLADQNDTLSVNLPATGGRLAPPELYVVTVIAMQAAPGAVFTGCSMTVNGGAATSYTFDNGIIPYLKASNILFT